MLQFINKKKEFKKSAEQVKKLKQKPEDDDLLIVYGLYKQASEGDVNTARPGMLSLDLKGTRSVLALPTFS